MRVVLLRGISGSGKGHYIDDTFTVGAHVVSADDFFEKRAAMLGESYKDVFDPMELPNAHAACLRKFVELVAGSGDEAPISAEDLEAHSEKVVVVDNTNCSIAEMAPYIALAQAYDPEVELEIVYLWCDPVTAFKRNQHGTPFNAVLRQFKSAERTELPPWWPRQNIICSV